MDKTMKSSLCKGLRACGIPKKQALVILNTFQKWYDCSGPEWANARVKDLRQWYESCLAGTPKAPEWFRHSKDQMPLGIWKWVFKLPIQKALGVLSLNTVLVAERLLTSQKEKILHGLAGNGHQSGASQKVLRDLVDHGIKLPLLERVGLAEYGTRYRPYCKKMPELRFPTIFDMVRSIPVDGGHGSIRPEGNLAVALKALEVSWEDVPQVTFDFLLEQGLEAYMPLTVLGNEYQLELNRPHTSEVGRVSVVQEEQLKARSVANPNRVLQCTLEPLRDVYQDICRKLPNVCVFNQEEGVRWVQKELQQGSRLSGSDLTTASDLLDVTDSLNLVSQVFGLVQVPGYMDYARYFKRVSRAEWFFKELDRKISWEQGQPMGTGPSIGLLCLTNFCAAFAANELTRVSDPGYKTHWEDAFRIIGDDIVMKAEISQTYTAIIESLGGEVNHTKTLESDRVAEFAGKVITSNSSFLKAVKYRRPSDNSFMEYVSKLGPQSKYFLTPAQRAVVDRFQEVPGVVVNGPWMKDSFGIPLSDRYQWYLEEVEPALRRVDPDLPTSSYEMVLLKAHLSQMQESNPRFKGTKEYSVTPYLAEGYLPSDVTPTFKSGGDPRLANGLTTLERLTPFLKEWGITDFDSWKKARDGQSLGDVHPTKPEPVLANDRSGHLVETKGPDRRPYLVSVIKNHIGKSKPIGQDLDR